MPAPRNRAASGHEHTVPPRARLAAVRQRAALLAQARAFFAERGYLEVETPVLARAGAADAQLAQFALNDPVLGALYLQTSPEYAMKRLIMAGSGSIYQITKAFRQGESGRFHNPEFTLVEWYGLGYDHRRLIAETCALIARLVPSLKAPARIVSYREAFREVLDIDPIEAPTDQLRAVTQRRLPAAQELVLNDRDEILDLLMSHAVAPGFPVEALTVVTDYPSSQAALARLNAQGLADRFEIYRGPLELANGFHEATRIAEYADRFALEAARRRARGLPHIDQDHRLLAALSEGDLPDCAGCALGFDRVLMLAMDATHIDEVLAFPIAQA
ncbi:MAG: EF-P lysine aminoacylase EpmA [Gammaproteobacteria bacterium]|nr:EF-P lysine aminoacylase EpmA [Gammaproteobacteria bacterium]